MMRLTLEHSGHTIEAASDGLEGLQMYGDGAECDLVLLDHRMPGMSGTEVQHEILRRNPDAKIVMVTAFGTIGLALEAIQSGAADFLRKPFTAEILRKAVAAALDRPTQRMSAVPVGMAVREFTRATINGFSFNLYEELDNEKREGDVVCDFEVLRGGDDKPIHCRVVLPSFVQELAKAHADSDTVPGGRRFWIAMCEEALANYLWQNSEIPAGNELRIDDLSAALKHWMETVLTVELTDHNAR